MLHDQPQSIVVHSNNSNTIFNYIVAATTFFMVAISCGCKQNTKMAIQSITPENMVDSFVVAAMEDNIEFTNFRFAGDSALIGWNDNSNEQTFYSKTSEGFIFQKKIAYPIMEYAPAFFTNPETNQRYVVANDNTWYRFQSDTAIKIGTIKLDMKFLGASYRFFSCQHYPVIKTDTSLIMSIADVTHEDYQNWFKEKSLCRIGLKDDSVQQIDYLFEKPASLIGDYDYFPVYCAANKSIYLVYPCVDSIYKYDMTTKSYTTYPIRNPLYARPTEQYDHIKAMQGDYNTKIQLANFRYSGIFYNPSTKHFILYFVTRTDEAIETPTFEDQKIKALVLDEDFRQLKMVEFSGRYRLPASYLIYRNGIAMPTFKNKYKNETQTSYHIYNL